MPERVNPNRHLAEDDPRRAEAREQQQATPLFSDRAVGSCNAQQSGIEHNQQEIAATHEKLKSITDEDDPDGEYRTWLRGTLESRRKFISDAEQLIKSEMQQLFEHLGTTLRNFGEKNPVSLLDSSRGSVAQKYIASRVEHMFRSSPEVEAEMRVLYGADFGKFSLGQFEVDVRRKIIPTEMLLTMANSNLEVARQEREAFLEFAEEVKSEFEAEVRKAVEEGWLPEMVLTSLPRLSSVTFSFEDFLYRANSEVLGTNYPHGFISISSLSMLNKAQLRHVIFHELTHEIAGQTYNLKNGTLLRGKIGVAMGLKNRWFDEAMTEKIATRLSGYQSEAATTNGGHNFYPKEQLVLEAMIDVDPALWDTALGAYFENISQKQSAQTKAAQFKQLVDQVNQQYGPHTWTKLNNQFLINHELGLGLGFKLYPEKDVKKAIGAGRDEREGVDRKVAKLIVKNKGGNEKGRLRDEFYLLSFSQAELNQQYAAVVRRAKSLGLEVSGLQPLARTDLVPRNDLQFGGPGAEAS